MDTTTPLADRIDLAYEYLVKRYYERNEFLSDSDVLDAADLFTTSNLDAVSAAIGAHDDEFAELLDEDRRTLRDALFALLAEEATA